MATGYGLTTVGLDSSPGRVKNILHIVQTGSDVQPTSYSMGTGDSSPRVKRRDVKLTTHLELVPRSKNVDLYVHSPIRLHGVVLN
jgi:hypothetical protein